MHRVMLSNRQVPTLALNAFGGAAHGTFLKLHDRCNVDNPDCTFTMFKGMMLSDRTGALRSTPGRRRGRHRDSAQQRLYVRQSRLHVYLAPRSDIQRRRLEADRLAELHRFTRFHHPELRCSQGDLRCSFYALFGR
jgi:hypothetical protein